MLGVPERCDMGAGHEREMSLLGMGEGRKFWAGCGNRPLSQGLWGEVAGPEPRWWWQAGRRMPG